MVLVNQDVQVNFIRTISQGYRAPEDYLDLNVTPQTLQVTDKVVDLLKGESKRNWQRKFGDC